MKDGLTLYFCFLGIGSSIATVISASVNNAPAAIMYASIVVASLVVTLALTWNNK